MIEVELKNIFESVKDSSNLELNYVLMFLMSKKNDLFSTMYSLFNIEEMYKFVRLYGGTTIEVPKVEVFKETLNTFIAYYLREIKKQSWEEIRVKFPTIEPMKEAHRINDIKARLYNVDVSKIAKLSSVVKEGL